MDAEPVSEEDRLREKVQTAGHGSGDAAEEQQTEVAVWPEASGTEPIEGDPRPRDGGGEPSNAHEPGDLDGGQSERPADRGAGEDGLPDGRIERVPGELSAEGGEKGSPGEGVVTDRLILPPPAEGCSCGPADAPGSGTFTALLTLLVCAGTLGRGRRRKPLGQD